MVLAGLAESLKKIDDQSACACVAEKSPTTGSSSLAAVGWEAAGRHMKHDSKAIWKGREVGRQWQFESSPACARL